MKYYKLDKDKREIIIDKNKKYNVNVDILDLIIDLQQENKRLKANEEFFCRCITKAIEYVKTKNYCSDIFTKDFAIFDKQELLNILKYGGLEEGEDK